MPFGWVGAIGSIGSALIGSSASQSAANTQAQSASDATAAETALYNQTAANVAPWVTAGQGALSSLVAGTQPGGALTQQTYAPQVQQGAYTATAPTFQNQAALTGSADLSTVAAPKALQSYNQFQAVGPMTAATFQQDPGYQFQLQQGNNALTNASSLSGGMNSNNLKGLIGYNQGMANTDYQQAFNNYQTNLNQYETQFGIQQGVNTLNNQNITQNLNNQLSATGFNNNVGQQQYANSQSQQLANNGVISNNDANLQQAFQNQNTLTGANNQVIGANNAANTQTQQLNNQNIQQQYSNLGALSQAGLQAGGQQIGASSSLGSNIGSNIIGAGNAQAAGTVGTANAITGGASSAYNAWLQQQYASPSAGSVGSDSYYANNDYLTS